MTIVSQLLQGKGTDIWSIKPEAKVYEALQMMADKNVGALVVLENEKLVGIISERDYARKVILHEKSSMQIPVNEIMTHIRIPMVLATGTPFRFQTLADSNLSWQALTAFFDGKNTFA